MVNSNIPLEDLVKALDAHSIVSITDMRGRITYFNDKFVEISQYTSQELMGQNHRLLKSGLHPQSFYDDMWITISSGKIWQGEIRNRKKDGSHYWVNSTIYPVLDENRLPHSYISIRTEITECILSEQALQRSNIELQLAREQAEAANLAKSTFLANMSHEIRTPLNSVIGLAQVGLLDCPDNNQKEYFQHILGSGNHLLGIINDILDISRIEAGKLTIENRPFGFAEIIDNISNMLLPQAREKKLQLEFELDAKIPHKLKGDPMRLGQILINFTGNAIKFTEQGKVSVRISLEKESENHCTVYCAVQDSGKGIEEADQKKLFQAFEQLDSSTRRKYGGTGLGLAISKNMAQLMGGQVGVHSQPGLGSTFWFTACLGKGDSQQAGQTQALPQAGTTQPDLAGARILVVEDNAFNLEVINASLSRKGIKIKVALNGKEALALLAVHRFDCILMDKQMPVMDGLEAARQIRSMPALASLPIIAMTASARPEDQQSCLAAGMDDFISKPIMLDQLYATLGKWLQRGTQTVVNTAQVEAHSPSSISAIDIQALADLLDNDRELMRKHALRFAQTAEESIAEMEAALAQKNLKQLNALSHRTYSSARMMGAHEFANLCQALEFLKQDANNDEARQLLKRLKACMTPIHAEIQKLKII